MSRRIDQAINGMLKTYQEQFEVNAYQINNGLCEDFANDIRNYVGYGEVEWNEDFVGFDTDMPAHAFFYSPRQRRYYDSECPKGVKDWMNLPLYERYFKSRPALKKKISKMIRD